MFSFNGPHGACPSCDGLGARTVVDPERVIGDPQRTLREGVILAWGRRGSVALATELARAVAALGVDPDKSWNKQPEDAKQALLFGGGGDADGKGKARGRGAAKKNYAGIVKTTRGAARGGRRVAFGARRHDDLDEDEGAIGDDEIGRFLVTRTCSACKGRRLRPEALAVKLGDKDVAELGRMPLEKLRAFLSTLGKDDGPQQLSARESAVAEPLLRAVTARLGFLIDVGLDYLSLDCSAQTLSSGEGQRIRLATQIGAALVGVLYVLDEPSVGLHARDNARLLEAQVRLRDLGNTVFVVEHDREAILAADHVVDMGPGAGVHGGQIVAAGTAEEADGGPGVDHRPVAQRQEAAPDPADAQEPRQGLGAHRGRPCAQPQGRHRRGADRALHCFTGVSGSGKSSLVVDTLLPAARAKLYSATAPIGECDAVEGLDNVDKVISIDQAPIGRTPRSNPATYTGVFSLLRELYAGLPEARARGYKAGRFSFNVKGGRCEACQGDGVLRVEMHFLPDIFVTCDTCSGKRYNRETLEVKYRGLSIADALEVTVEQALPLFETIPRVRDRLDALRRVGLGYLTLGQPATTLSGGEAQRVKLARELARKATGRTLYVLDEPTTGLHFTDIEVLLAALLELRDQGNTVVVIEHNLDVVACADWVIDLGPEGGDKGGTIVASGTPETVVTSKPSHTARYLAEVLARATATKPSKKKGAAAEAT